MNASLSVLTRSDLFSGLPEREIRRLLDQTPHKIHSYHPDEIILLRGDAYREMLIILSGEIITEMQDAEGKVVRIETFTAADLIAPAVLFGGSTALPVTVKARTESVILSIGRDQLLSLCMRSESILAGLLRNIGDKVNFLAKRVFLLEFTTIRQKIAHHVLSLAQRQSSDIIRLDQTREELAEMFGAARPSVSRALGSFVQEGVLAIQGREITILDREELEAQLTLTD